MGQTSRWASALQSGGITVLNTLYDDPEHDDFIADASFPRDWRISQNNILWQGLSGINNPCPQGFRILTEEESETERASWDSDDAKGAFASPLKLVKAGLRSSMGDGSISSDD